MESLAYKAAYPDKVFEAASATNHGINWWLSPPPLRYKPDVKERTPRPADCRPADRPNAVNGPTNGILKKACVALPVI